MRRFSIGEVCNLLQVKPHVLRYWEQEFPLLSPEKDQAGRRVYSLSDLQILFRIRYLLYERRFTLEGARQKLWEELSGQSANVKADIHAVRAALLDLAENIRSWRERIDRVLTQSEKKPKS